MKIKAAIALVNPMEITATVEPEAGMPETSQSVKIADLGVIDYAKVFSEGPQTLHTMGIGEVLSTIRFLAADYQDPTVGVWGCDIEKNGLVTVVGTLASLVRGNGYARGNAGDFLDTLGMVAEGAGSGVAPSPESQQVSTMQAYTGPAIYAAFSPTSGEVPRGIMTGMGPWKAKTPYDAYEENTGETLQRSVIEAEGFMWVNEGTAGESSAVEPTFNPEGEPVNDGPNIIWKGNPNRPPFTQGTIHAVAEIWTPS